MLELVTHDGVPSDEDVRARWAAVLDADPLATFFHTPEYLALWAEVLGTRSTVLVHEAQRDGTTVGIIPVAIQREGSPTRPIELVRFAGGTEVTDYLGPVAAPEDRAEVAQAYAAKLAADADWDELVLGGLVAGSGWSEAWRAACAEAGITYLETVDEDVCPRVDLSGGYADYLSRLGGKLRHEMKRKARKLARDAGDLQLVEVPRAEHAEALERFFAFNVEQGEDKGAFFEKDEMRTWFHALAEHFTDTGVFRLHELHVGGLPAASCVSLVDRGEWGLYNSAFDATLAMLAPGMVIVGELIEVAAEEGCEVFDLLRGAEEYKYRFGPEDRRLVMSTYERG